MVRRIRRILVAAFSLAAAGALGQAASEFEVGVGYLSTGVGALVEKHGWDLVWAAEEDRMVEFPFSIAVPAGSDEDALKGALTNLLDAFEGQFVADMYRGNRVVVIDVAPPNLRAARPSALAVVRDASAPGSAATSGGEATGGEE